MAKDADYRRLIHTQRWLRLRRRVLTEHPLCRRCADEGYVTAATEVHHLLPVEEAATLREKERLMFDPSNLRALCHACHVRTHTEMGRCGKALTRRRNAAQVESFRRRFFGDAPASEGYGGQIGGGNREGGHAGGCEPGGGEAGLMGGGVFLEGGGPL